MVSIIINGQQAEFAEGTSLLVAVQSRGIAIPSLCYHSALSPSGTCRLCAIEVEAPSSRPAIKLACAFKVKPDLVVVTESDLIQEARRRAFARLVQMAPNAPKIRDLARHWGVDPGPELEGCIHCRICTRVCKEVVGANALTVDKRKGVPYVTPIPDRCIGCGTCANLCPTGAIRLIDQDGFRIITIRDEVIGRHPLHRCEGCGRHFATQRFLDHIHRRNAPHPETKEAHRYCPTCAKLFSTRVQTARDHIQR
ncbi:MAG: (2Fe-2S)-binding protein [Proteobacteria bacterium]|nr:(2Fe-2S)-binding protein [Pseudomonadota bacterium]